MDAEFDLVLFVVAAAVIAVSLALAFAPGFVAPLLAVMLGVAGLVMAAVGIRGRSRR